MSMKPAAAVAPARADSSPPKERKAAALRAELPLMAVSMDPLMVSMSMQMWYQKFQVGALNVPTQTTLYVFKRQR